MNEMQRQEILHLPTWLEIDLDVLHENVRLIRAQLDRGVRVMLTVKADGYGHGAVQVARAVEDIVDYFGVATLDEAIELASAGVHKGILILSPILSDEIPVVVEHGFATTISSLEFAAELAAAARDNGRTASVHIEVDSGMGRTGFLPQQVDQVVERIRSMHGLRLGGFFTHFSASDSDVTFTEGQLRKFLETANRALSTDTSPLLHSANSAAIPNVPASHLQMVRPGLLAYGLHPGGVYTKVAVKAVMSWRCRIVQVREVPAGTPISYAGTFTTRRPTRMAVLPVGYGHGYPFRVSNKGSVLVAGQRAPVIGRVTMDMTLVDVTNITPRPSVGDEVVLIGSQGDHAITADDIATWVGTISYEIMTGISKRVARAYLRAGKVEAIKTLLGIVPNNISV